MKIDIKGLRTWSFAIIALAFLTFGLGMSLDKPQAGIALFGSFSLAVVGIVGAVAGKSTIGALGEGSGIKGVINTVLTSAKPGEPAPPAPKP
jgi:hypothetical protein